MVGLAAAARTVDADNFIAAVNAGAVTRGSGDRSHHHDMPRAHLHLDAHAAELTGQVLLQFGVVLRFQVFRMRIKRLDHAVDRIARQCVVAGRTRIDVVFMHNLQDVAHT